MKMAAIDFNPRSPHGERRASAENAPVFVHFNPRSPHGERPKRAFPNTLFNRFQPTLPARGATAWRRRCPPWALFQPTLPARGATSGRCCSTGSCKHFNPRSPHGERPCCPFLWRWIPDFNPRSPHGERHGGVLLADVQHGISTHAPRTGSDFNPPDEGPVARAISTHAPRTGSDADGYDCRRIADDFNPRSPHGERPTPAAGAPPEAVISTHAPRTGSDDVAVLAAQAHGYFNPRSPHGERRRRTPCATASSPNFNPRSPHGERRYTDTDAKTGKLFQPTLPARGATPCRGGYRQLRHISTHAPRTGSDVCGASPSGAGIAISTHAPRTGSDYDYASGAKAARISTHAPRTGSDSAIHDGELHHIDFNPRSPHGERHRRFQPP